MASVIKFHTKAALWCVLVILLPVVASLNRQENAVQQMSQKKHQGFLSLSSFNWKDCGAASDPGHLSKLSLLPDPMKLPGNVTVAFEAKLDVDLSSPIALDVNIQKKILVWITLPCVHDLGSCHYPDICPLLAKLDCPKAFKDHGISCKCPVLHNAYDLPPSVLFIDDGSLPALLADGEYRVTAKLSQNQKSIGCGYFEFSITQ